MLVPGARRDKQAKGFGPARSLRALWGLNELGAEFESCLSISVRGAAPAGVPAPQSDQQGSGVGRRRSLVLNESAAIVLYLAEKYPDKGLLPADLKQRAEVYRWVMFAVTELEQPLWRITKHSRLYPEDKRLPQDIARAKEEFAAMAAVLERHMEGRSFIVGDGITAADCVTAYVIDWADWMHLIDDCPNLKAYVARMYSRSAAPPRIAEAFANIQAER